MSLADRSFDSDGNCVCGFNLGDNMAILLYLRFADDIPLLARTAAEAMAVLDDQVHKLQNIGLQLNTG